MPVVLLRACVCVEGDDCGRAGRSGVEGQKASISHHNLQQHGLTASPAAPTPLPAQETPNTHRSIASDGSSMDLDASGGKTGLQAKGLDWSAPRRALEAFQLGTPADVSANACLGVAMAVHELWELVCSPVGQPLCLSVRLSPC